MICSTDLRTVPVSVWRAHGGGRKAINVASCECTLDEGTGVLLQSENSCSARRHSSPCQISFSCMKLGFFQVKTFSAVPGLSHEDRQVPSGSEIQLLFTSYFCSMSEVTTDICTKDVEYVMSNQSGLATLREAVTQAIKQSARESFESKWAYHAQFCRTTSFTSLTREDSEEWSILARFDSQSARSTIHDYDDQPSHTEPEDRMSQLSRPAQCVT